MSPAGSRAGSARVPRLARWIVTALVPDPDREFLLGDLDEQFRAEREAHGRLAAWFVYWRQVLQSALSTGRLARRRAALDRARLDGLLGSTPRRSFDVKNLLRDAKAGFRTALRSPGYSAIAVLTLALAIGANTLLFSIANPLLIKPLPIKDQATLGWIWEVNGPAGVDRGRVSAPDLVEWRAASHTFSSLAAYSIRYGTLTGLGPEAESVYLSCVTPNLQEVWGLHAALGRLFQPGENAPGRPLVGVLAYHYWNGKGFSGDPSAIGRTYMLNGTPITIVGVMEQEIELGTLGEVDMYVPLPLDSAAPRDDRTLHVIGRLAPGATVESADAELRGLSATQARDHAATNRDWQAHVVSTTQAIVGPDTWILIGLLAVVVGFVLLIACANLANLVLARIVARRQEFAVRQALGASRLQLIRPLFAESLLIALAGGLAGLGLAHAGLRAINATAYDRLLQQIGIDGNVLIFTAALAILTPFLFSLWPALGAGRTVAAESLRAARSASGGPGTKRRSRVLVASQVALALSLLVVSALILQTVQNVKHLQIGLDVPKLITSRVDLPRDRYPDDTARVAFVHETVDRLRTLPGATGGAVASHLPVFDSEVVDTLSGTLHDTTGDTARPWASWFAVSPSFFQTVGIPLVAGRGFQVSDGPGAAPVALLSRLAAERYFDDVSAALGRPLVVGGRSTADRTVTIVGVVADTHNSAVLTSSPQIYVPIDQWPVGTMRLVVRSDAPGERAADMRQTMRELDQTIAISNPETMRDEVMESMADNRIVNALFGGFALLALVLAGAGLYGVIWYSVSQRQREIGVRLALGAARGAIRRMVVRDGLRVTFYGTIAGLALAFFLAHASASVLYGVSANDPGTFGAVVGLVVLVSLAALWAPAIRAMRIDPIRALRE